MAMNAKKLMRPRTERAQTMVEFALVLPFLLVLILGVIEVGRLLFISARSLPPAEAARGMPG
jgi:Flp pilus assembly protein TadG